MKIIFVIFAILVDLCVCANVECGKDSAWSFCNEIKYLCTLNVVLCPYHFIYL